MIKWCRCQTSCTVQPKERWGGGFGIRREDCEALDKLQEAFDWYNWGISEGHEDSMVENSN